MLLSKSVTKQYEFLALTVVSCYRTPFADCALSSIIELLADQRSNDFIILGDLNWNWLQPVSNDFSVL